MKKNIFLISVGFCIGVISLFLFLIIYSPRKPKLESEFNNMTEDKQYLSINEIRLSHNITVTINDYHPINERYDLENYGTTPFILHGALQIYDSLPMDILDTFLFETIYNSISLFPKNHIGLYRKVSIDSLLYGLHDMEIEFYAQNNELVVFVVIPNQEKFRFSFTVTHNSDKNRTDFFHLVDSNYANVELIELDTIVSIWFTFLKEINRIDNNPNYIDEIIENLNIEIKNEEHLIKLIASNSDFSNNRNNIEVIREISFQYLNYMKKNFNEMNLLILNQIAILLAFSPI